MSDKEYQKKSTLGLVAAILSDSSKGPTKKELEVKLIEKQRTIDDLTGENERLKKQNEIDRQQQLDQEMKIKLTQDEMQILKSKIISLEDGKCRFRDREEDLKRRARELEDEADSKEHDLRRQTRKLNEADLHLQEKTEQIEDMKRKLLEANTKVLQGTEKDKKLQDELEKLRNENKKYGEEYCCKEKELNTQIQKLQTDLKDKHQEISTLSNNIKKTELEVQKWKNHAENLNKELEEKKIDEATLKRKIACLQEETGRLKKRTEDVSRSFEKHAEEKKNMSKKQTDAVVNQIRDMEETARQSTEKTQKLAEENQSIKKENDSLKQQKIVLEAQDASSRKDIADLRARMAALQASSETREKMLQADIERLTRQRITDIQKQEEKHASEKEEMQLQIQKFLQILNVEKNVERETIRSVIQQVAHTNTIANQILQAAFRTFCRRQNPTARIHEVDDDV